MFSAPVYQGQAVRDRQNSQIRKTSLDSIHMDLDSYEVHEQEDIKSWLSCSQEMQPDAIEAVRRLSYDGATVKKCVRYPAPPSPPRAFATLPPGTGPTSWWVEPCNPSTTAALSPGRRSSIPLPRSHREMPAAKPRQDTFWTELPQSPRCPSYPCTPNSKPQQRSPSRPMVAEMAKRRQPSQIRRQGPEGDSSARDCVGDEESGVALPAPRYSKDQEVPIIQQDCRTEDETEDTIIEQLLSGDKSGLQGRGGDGGEEDRQDTWDKEVIKGSLLHPLVPPCLPPGVRRLNLPPRSDEIHHPAPIDAWALIKGSGAALMKNLQDSGLMPLEDTPRSGPAHSRQGSWPALGIVDAKMDAVEDMDVPMSSFTTYLQNNTLFTATDGALPPNTPLVSPRVDDDGENPYSPPTPYRLGYAPGNPATVRPFKMETSPRKNDPTGAGASQDAPKNIFGSLLSNVQMLVDSVHSRRPEKEEASHHRPPQEVEEEASGQEEEEEEETEASGEEAEEVSIARAPPANH